MDNGTMPGTSPGTTPASTAIFGSATYAAGGIATPGACPVDCSHTFYMFLAVVCLLKFSGATGRATNFLVSVRWAMSTTVTRCALPWCRGAL